MFLPLALVLLLILCWSIYWYIASGIARDRLMAERALLAEQGWRLACTEEDWGGYPFHFEFTCRSPVLTFDSEAEARAGNLLLVALAYAPWQVAVLLDGPTTVTGAGLPPTKLEHERALAAVTFGKDSEASVSAELPAVSIANLGHADKLMAHSRPAAGGGTDIAVSVTGLLYEPPDKQPLAIADGNLLGTLKPDQTFRVEKFELQQGDLRYWGSGTLSLDQDHRIAGQLATETNDSKTLLGLLAPHLDISDAKLANLRTMLGLLGSGAKATIIAKDGVLYAGPFQVAVLRPLF